MKTMTTRLTITRPDDWHLHLRDGDLMAANEMLGRPHEVRGVVDHGDKRARELGFRTANLDVPAPTLDQLLKAIDERCPGFYARVVDDGQVRPELARARALAPVYEPSVALRALRATPSRSAASATARATTFVTSRLKTLGRSFMPAH